ncbi:MAG: PIN domain-containing protein [Deltaproteobacteria bacterium]|nr:PIN domain-containing protein [Deltaproteobacteria bacterium]MBW2256800.1 PIN domain-containing protein [Deltaproteobacteria bacterium]
MSEAEVAGLAFDTSVIVAALLSWHERHQDARPLLQRALQSGEPVIVPLPALFEAYSVMTRLPPPWRLSVHDAHALLERTFRARAIVPSLDGNQAWSLLDDATRDRVSGGAIYDAHIAACARLAGADRLATLNPRHFERLELKGLHLVVPGPE